MTSPLPDPKQQSRELMLAGRHREARAACRRLCEQGSVDPEVWDMLGQLEAMAGDWQSAESCFRRAVALDPLYVSGHCNLGVVLQERGDLDGAVACYEQALALKPDEPSLYCNLGNILATKNDTEGARRLYERSIAFNPANIEPRLALGLLFEKEGKLDAARDCYEQVLARAPEHARAYFGLGNAALAGKQLDEAERCFRAAVIRDPGHAESWNNLGNALVQQNRRIEALECFREATRLNPRHSGAWYNLGLAHASDNRQVEALECYRKAIECNPKHVDAWRNAAGLLGKRNRFDEAVAYYERARLLAPAVAEVHAGLCLTLIKSQRFEEGVARLQEAITLMPQELGDFDSLLFCENYAFNLLPEQVFGHHRLWGERFGLTRAELGPPPFKRNPQRRIRVGYVSPDFRSHSVAYFIEPVLKAHDHGRFEIFCYAEVAAGKRDAVTARIQSLSDHWFETTGVSDEEFARRIRADGIDILVDLAGHTAHNRLRAFAYRPAPVQASWIGYCNTTGLPAMDYRITDRWADPDGCERFNTEALVRLPLGFLCYAPPEGVPDAAARPADLAPGQVTFGSFNELSKVNPAVIALWARVLGAVPESRLLVKSRSLADAATCERLYQRFESHGMSRDRIELVSWLPNRDDHLSLYGKVDVALDTFPYNGTTTTCEALWMGVPVITLAGDRHAARVGVSILSRLNLGELVAGGHDDYVAKAAGLAGNSAYLGSLRANLRERMRQSSLCDPAPFTRTLEDTYIELCNRAGR